MFPKSDARGRSQERSVTPFCCGNPQRQPPVRRSEEFRFQTPHDAPLSNGYIARVSTDVYDRSRRVLDHLRPRDFEYLRREQDVRFTAVGLKGKIGPVPRLLSEIDTDSKVRVLQFKQGAI